MARGAQRLVPFLCLPLAGVGCGGEPSTLDTADATTGDPDAVELVLTDVTAASPDLLAHPYGGAAGWDHSDKYAPGVALVDLDGDGALDVIQPRNDRADPSLRSLRLYRGAGDGTFAEIEPPAWDESRNATCVVPFDRDADGDLDVFVGVDGGPSVLYDNRGAGAGTIELVDVAAAAGVAADGHRVFACAAGDVDGDGDLDLYLGTWNASAPDHGPGTAPNLLLLNDGAGAFTDATDTAGAACAGRATLGLALADLDRDGDLDIYVANDFFDDCLLENRGDGTFTDVAAAAGVADGASRGMGVAVGDLDGDLDLDLLVTDTENPDASFGNAVYLNTGDGLLFDSRGEPLGLDGLTTLGVDWFVGWGAGFVDFDLDGDLDVHVATHIERAELVWRNDGGAFTPQRAIIDGLPDADARGSAYGDIDGDGDEDVVIGRRGAPLQILRNDTQTGGAVVVRVTPPHLAPGTIVTADHEGRRLVRLVQAGSSFMSSGDAVVHLPAGAAVVGDKAP